MLATLLAAVIAATAAGAFNVVISLLAQALGATVTWQLSPMIVLIISASASIVGATGWSFIRQLCPHPREVLMFVVPVVLLLSLAPDLVLTIQTVSATGWGTVIAALTMHVFTIIILISVYLAVLPLKPDAEF